MYQGVGCYKPSHQYVGQPSNPVFMGFEDTPRAFMRPLLGTFVLSAFPSTFSYFRGRTCPPLPARRELYP